MPSTPAAGWAKTATRPASITSIGSTSRLAPALVARCAAASASSVATYIDHAGGWPSCMIGPTPATCLPRTVNIP
jgi:hypothetical protein